nr:MAG TPA: hypothetical protein [Caudoviricetes sp.]
MLTNSQRKIAPSSLIAGLDVFTNKKVRTFTKSPAAALLGAILIP